MRFLHYSRWPKDRLGLKVLIAANLVIGAFILPQYGESWDEYSLYNIGSYSLHIVRAWLGGQTQIYRFPSFTQWYGAWPWMMIVASHHFVPRIPFALFLHGIAWLFFQIALVALFFIAVRYLKPRTALWVVLLFETQPLLWGHAFINPKDMSLMAAMLASVLLGLRWVDTIAWSIHSRSNTWQGRIRSAWRQYHLGHYIALTVPSTLLSAAVAIWAWRQPITIPPDMETEASASFAHVLRGEHAVLAGSITLALLLLTAGRLITPALFRALKANVKLWWRVTQPIFRSPSFWIASGALGLTASIRVLGWWVGIIVLFIAWQKYGPRVLAIGLAYLAIAFGVQVAVWPAAWSAPLAHSITALLVMSRFPWHGKVLFAGAQYSSAQLPWWYVPWLHMIQVTEPAIILALAGFVLLWLHRAQQRELFMLVSLWYIVPLALIIWRHPVLYDNARQFLALLPPLFLAAGYMAEQVSRSLASRPRCALAAGLLLPGILFIYLSHPYQYVYYNAVVGGIKGAYHHYELDYWGTSFQEAAHYLDAHVREGSSVQVWGPFLPLIDATHKKYNFYRSGANEPQPKPPFYAVVLVRADWETTIYPRASEVYRVTLWNGVPLSIVRYVRDKQPLDN